MALNFSNCKYTIWAAGGVYFKTSFNFYVEKVKLIGVITPNQIPLTTIVTYLQKCHCVIIHQTTKATEYIG